MFIEVMNEIYIERIEQRKDGISQNSNGKQQKISFLQHFKIFTKITKPLGTQIYNWLEFLFLKFFNTILM